MALAQLLLMLLSSDEFTVEVERQAFTVEVEQPGTPAADVPVSGTIAQPPTAPPSVAGHYVVVFGAAWCAPCQRMKANTVPALRKAGIVVRQMDIDTDAIHKTWRISSVPVTWIVDPATRQPVKRFVGYVSSETVLREMRHVSAGVTRTKTVVRESRQTMSHSDMVRLHNQLHGGGQWTWPGDLRTHLRTTHGVHVE